MSEENQSNDSNRRTFLQLAGLAGLPLALSGTASAATDHDHLGETWSVDSTFDQTGLKIETGDTTAFKGTTDTGSTAISALNLSDNGGYGIYGYSSASDGHAVHGLNNSGGYAVYSDGDLHVDGDFTASGTKNFVQTVDTADGEKRVAYTAVEADRAQTETTGVAELEDGRAEIDLPEHFGMVTSDDEDLVVQLTPYAVDVPGLAVTERTTDHIVVESREGTGDFEFSYTVRGVREGYENAEVVRDSE
ncbi:hypothetical protein [Halorussus caseinilyticus]|uniref:Uncharacterized protein n=1 Tax=Halorussus caseinilyticus TaxID=3034025 RepID=A0ABD5WPG0_9EURY|nr:hypothetical protein [Halorussus sp. DT72]